MKLKNAARLAVINRLSYNEAEYQFHNGTLSARDWHLFQFLWTWSSSRYSGRAGDLQEAYYKKHGGEALLRRFNFIRRLTGLDPI